MDIITKEEFINDIERYFDLIRECALFIHPTDTIYGMGCDATNDKAVKKLRKAKHRYERPFSVIAPGKEWIRENCIINKNAEKWLKKLPGPYTLILKLKNKDCIAKNTNNCLDTLGVRIPNHWISKIIKEHGMPIVTTSANLAGGNFMTSPDNLDIELKSKIDFVIYEGEKKGMPSKIIDLSEGEKVIER